MSPVAPSNNACISNFAGAVTRHQILTALLLAAVIAAIAGTLFVDTAVAADTIHVKTAATGSGDGSTWANATTLQDALQNRAVSGDEIWVAAGVYTPGVSETDSFPLPSGVEVYGGFVGTETDRNQREWQTNVTVLSGDIGDDDITDANGVVTDTDNIVGTNSLHVIYADGSIPITNTTVLDGFTITAGQASEEYPSSHGYGGGLFCRGINGRVCSPSIANIIFSGNSAKEGGSAIYSNGGRGISSPVLTDITFIANSSSAMYNDGDHGISNPVLTNVTFSNNERGMYNYAKNGGISSPVLTDVSFTGHSGTTMYNQGSHGESSPVLTNVTFNANGSTAMYNDASFYGVSSPVLTNVTFFANVEDVHGVMFNDASYYGVSSPTLTNVIFSANDAIAMCSAAPYGTSNASLTNVTFSGNSGAAMQNSASDGECAPTIINSIIWGNGITSDGIEIHNINTSAKPTIAYSLVRGGINGAYVHNERGRVIDGGGNLAGGPDDNPRFVRPVDASEAPTQTADLHLQTGSPAIDVGSNSAVTVTTDLDGNPRKQDGNGDGTIIVDLGAYEAPTLFLVNLTHNGGGSGKVDAEPEGVATCTSPCIGMYATGTVVTLTATADTGSIFSDWSGSVVSSVNPVTMTVDSEKNITVTFSVPGSIKGSVMDEASNPLQGVTVTLSSELSGALATVEHSTSTDAAGAYQFDDLLPGNYTLTFAKAGYESPDPVDVPLAEGQAYTADDVEMAESSNPVFLPTMQKML